MESIVRFHKLTLLTSWSKFYGALLDASGPRVFLRDRLGRYPQKRARRRSRHFAPYRNSALGRAKLLLHRPVGNKLCFVAADTLFTAGLLN